MDPTTMHGKGAFLTSVGFFRIHLSNTPRGPICCNLTDGTRKKTQTRGAPMYPLQLSHLRRIKLKPRISYHRFQAKNQFEMIVLPGSFRASKLGIVLVFPRFFLISGVLHKLSEISSIKPRMDGFLTFPSIGSIHWHASPQFHPGSFISSQNPQKEKNSSFNPSVSGAVSGTVDSYPR